MKATFQRINTALRQPLEERGSIYFSYTDVVFKYPCLRLYNTALLTKAKLFNSAIVHVIGDSHVRPFVFRSPFLVHHISQATAYNLNKDNSFSQSKRYLDSFLSKIDKERDILLLVFGEIDARVHIYSQHKKSNGKISIEKIVEATVQRYGETIRRLKNNGFAVCIHGISPAAKKDFTSSLPFLGSPEQRSQISREFNKKLGEFCRENDIPYIDVQSVSADENGFIKREYLADEVHLNGKIVPFARGIVVEAFKTSRNL
jgi:lysophospholipase L1-like esterase